MKRGFTLTELSITIAVMFVMAAMVLKHLAHERQMESIDTFKQELALIIDAYVFGAAGSGTGYIYGVSGGGFCSTTPNYLDDLLTMGRVFLCLSEGVSLSPMHGRVYDSNTSLCPPEPEASPQQKTDCNHTANDTSFFRSSYLPQCESSLSINNPDGNRSVVLTVTCEGDERLRQSVAIQSIAFLERISGRTNPKLGINPVIHDSNFSIEFPENQL